MNRYNITVILPVINETFSLIKTIKLIEKNNFKKKIVKVLIILSKEKTIQKTKKICFDLSRKSKNVEYIYQTKPFLGGAMQDAFNVITTTHCIMMSSDLETNPNSLKEMIKASYYNKDSIITASRWIKNSAFKNYGTIKIILNFIFQKIFSILYATKLNDLTFGYRIFPTKVIKKITWEMLDHSFLFETILKPLKIGTNIIQISTNWVNRREGKSSNNTLNYFKYFYIGFKIFLINKKNYLNNYD